MRVTVLPSVAKGRASAPPSKSMAHRLLICGALSSGSHIENLAYSKDVSATLGCIKALGATVREEENGVFVGGLDTCGVPDNAELYVCESGSTLRFLIPLCMLSRRRIVLSGSERLFERPLGVYRDIAERFGMEFSVKKDRLTVCGRLESGDYEVPGDISSQFITGLLFALPLTEGDSTLTVTGRFESASYIDLTLSALDRFGIKIERYGNVFKIKGGQSYLPCTLSVEGDCSNAAFLEALNVLGGDVEVTGVSADTLQGDRVYTEIFERLKNGDGGEIDLSDCPDLAPVCFAVAAANKGGRFVGTARLRIKESDRAAAMAEELAKFGITLLVDDNSVTVSGGEVHAPHEPLFSHNDHRIVMALAVLATVTGGVIEDAGAVSKSYPNFFEVLKSLRIGIEIE